MKNYLRYIVGLLWVAAWSIAGPGCKKSSSEVAMTNPALSLTSFSPKAAIPSTEVTIRGAKFGTFTGAISVYFGGIAATQIDSVSDSVIMVKVPATAVSGAVSVKVWNASASTDSSFTVLPMPVVISDSSRSTISPAIAVPGDTVDIKGINFLTDRSKVSIDFNGTPATNIISLTGTLIQVIAPSGYTAGNVNIYFSGIRFAAPGALAPALTTGDVSAYFLKNYKQPILVNALPQPPAYTDNGPTYGRWFTPMYWTVTPGVKNHTNSVSNTAEGGLDYRPTNSDQGLIFGCEAGWGAPEIINGKVYQVVTLLPGTYTFSADMRENGFNNNVYLCAATDSLPDAGNINSSTTLGFSAVTSTWHNNGDNDNIHDIQSFNFTVSSKTKVALGYVIPDFDAGGNFIRFQYFKLVLN